MRKLYPAPLVLAVSARYQLVSYAGGQWRVLLGSDVIEGIFEKLEAAHSSLIAKAG